MLKKVIRLKSEQYEKLYQGEVVSSHDGMTNLKLDLNNFNLIINDTSILSKLEYIIETFDKYLSKQDASDMLSLDIIDNWPPEVELSFYNNSSYTITLSGGIATTIAAGNTYSTTVPCGTYINTIIFNCSDIEATSASVTPGVLTSNYTKTITIGSTTTPTGLTGTYTRTISGTQAPSVLWQAVNWTFVVGDNELYQPDSATLTDSGSTLQGYRSAGEPEQDGNRVTVHWEINTKTKVGRRAYNFVVKITTDKYETTYFIDVGN